MRASRAPLVLDFRQERSEAITNCHTHTFTTAHTPRHFPAWPVVIFRYAPWLIQFLRWASWFLPWRGVDSKLLRLEKFHRTGSRTSQRAVFREVLHYYPESARFVVLPLDMGPVGHGPVYLDLRDQHDELARLAAKHEHRIVPFANVHPATPGTADEFRRCIEQLGFRGPRLHPKLSFKPDDLHLRASHWGDKETVHWTVSPTNRPTADIVELATAYGRYGYRGITALLRKAGSAVKKKRVERTWRREGMRRERATGPSAAPNGAEKRTGEGPAVAH